MADFDAMMARENLMMGRRGEYMNGWSTAFTDEAGVEHEVATVVYRLPAHKTGTIQIPVQYRVAVYMDGRPAFGGVVD